MKRTKIIPDISQYPRDLHRFLQNAEVFDSSCSPEAKVIFIDKDGGYYLKSSAKGTLEKEAKLTEYFNKKGLSSAVVRYLSGDGDWLLTERVRGEDCTHPQYLADPERLCDLWAVTLRELHETDGTGCPVSDRCADYLATVEENYRAGRYELEIGGGALGFGSAEEAYREVERNGCFLKSDTLIHGDYCLPNVMLDGWQLSGLIDLGNGGIGDRHIDLFWGAWTLNYNLKTDKYRDRFFDAYGRDAVDLDRLRTVAAAEVFG